MHPRINTLRYSSFPSRQTNLGVSILRRIWDEIYKGTWSRLCVMKSSQATGKLESADATSSSDDSRSWTYWRGDAAEGFEKPGPLKDDYYVIHSMAQLPKQDHYDYIRVISRPFLIAQELSNVITP